MKQDVVLAIRGRQSYEDQEPDVIELTTDGTMEFRDGGWDISYEETALTGMEGVTTVFRVEPDKVILTRTGKLRSQMIFQKGLLNAKKCDKIKKISVCTPKRASLYANGR